jgi:hypothetical protein
MRYHSVGQLVGWDEARPHESLERGKLSVRSPRPATS